MNFGINVGKLLESQGSVGEVYELNLGKKKYIVKYIDHESQEENDLEIEITLRASELGIAPKVLSYSDNYIVMEYIKQAKLSKEEFEEIIPLINEKLDILYDHGIYHGDLIKGNVIVSERGRIYIIDYGLSEYSEDPIPQKYRKYFK